MTHRRLVVLVVFIAIFSFDLARETDIDFWWHLRTGQLIADTGAVPTIDPFSYTAQGRPWIAHEWLWELGAYYLYELGGYRLLVALSALVVTLAYGVLYRLLRGLGMNEIASAALVLWAAALALPNLGVRPREFTHLFLAVYLERLLLHRAGKVRRLWVLPVLMVAWVNLHGAFGLGLVVLGLSALGGCVESLRAGRPLPRHLLIVTLLTVLAATLNPAGPRLILYPFNYYVAEDNPSFRIVTEFQSPNFHEPLLLFFIAGLVGLMLLPRQRRFGFSDGLLIGAFVLQALVSARQVSVCALVLAPQLATRLADRFRLAADLPASRLPRGLRVVNWLVLVLLLIGAVIGLRRPQFSAKLQLSSEPDTGLMPFAGASFVEARALPGPVFHDQAWGGYLIHRWYPSRKVFIDGRIDMYGPEIADDYVKVTTVRPEWRQILDHYGIRTVLIGKDSALSTLLANEGHWERVFQGEVEDVFVRARSQADDEGS